MSIEGRSLITGFCGSGEAGTIEEWARLNMYVDKVNIFYWIF